MKLGLFFLGIILLGFCFEFVEHLDNKLGTIDLFYLRDVKWNPSSYVYFTGESLAYIAMGLMIRKLTTYKHIALAFVVVESIDLIDFYITKNDLWFTFYGWPITYNVIKVFVFTLFFCYELIRNTSTGKA